MKVYTKAIKRQAKRSLAWVLETDSILFRYRISLPFFGGV